MTSIDQVITGRYQLGRLLGSGGFGAVYFAEDLRLQRPVAIKVCSTRSLPPDEAEQAALLFQREALTLARLRHPGLTAVWDYFSQDDEWFLVMEYVPGESLREVLKEQGGRLPVAQAINYTSQLCDVLRYLHTQPHPIVFRDLKPGNIMVTPSGELKLIDFGIARLFSPGKTTDTAQFGTPGYAPPEQYGGQTEPRSDIYSLGAVVHQMLTGHNPGASPFALPPARAVNPALSPQIEQALIKATAHRPADRFASVDEFCSTLRMAQGPTVTGPTVPITSPNTLKNTKTVRTEPASRPLWTPAPRSLPDRPHQGGVVRGLILLTLIFVLGASLAVAGWMFRDPLIAGLGLDSLRPSRSTPGLSLPGVVAYVAPTSGGGADLYTRSGTTVKQLTEYPSGIAAALPAISPDRSQIAYVESTPSSETLWLIDIESAERRRLLTQFPIARAPSWSPDGRRLLVEVAQPGNAWVQHDIVELNLDTNEVRTIMDSDAWEGAPVWSPDGNRIAFSARLDGSSCMRIYLLDLGSGTPAEVTQPPSADACTSRNGDFWPAWSPDGKHIAFGRKYDGTERVAVMEVATGSIEVWDTGPKPAGHPRWSPNSQQILFEEDNSADNKSLVRLSLNNGKVEVIDPGRPGSLADWR